jgi:hypothetical protein
LLQVLFPVQPLLPVILLPLQPIVHEPDITKFLAQ